MCRILHINLNPLQEGIDEKIWNTSPENQDREMSICDIITVVSSDQKQRSDTIR